MRHLFARFTASAGLRLPVILVLLVLATAISSQRAEAQQRGVPIVRDAEIEALVREYTRPILNAAGLSRSGVEVVLVNDPSFNAFVAGRRMFINVGALMISETPNEIIGVIAHEAGHLAGGHQERLRDQLARAQTMAIVAGLLGIGATVAGAMADQGAIAGAGAGLAMGGGEAARRSLLAYQRTEEITADRAAITYLERTGQSARGMLNTFQRFANSMMLQGSRIDPYTVSHPMPRERLANLEELARRSPHFDRADPPQLQTRHDMMRAKIAAYTQGQGFVQRMFRSNPRSAAALYGDAIITYLYGNPAQALAKVDALIQSNRGNPYFHELRGEILMKANRPAEAAQAFQTAVRNDPSGSGLIQVSVGRALVATGRQENLRPAIAEIRKGLDRDRENATGYQVLAQAHGQLGQIGEAELATAEYHFYRGAWRDAQLFAARAQMRLQRGSPPWVRAQDIVNYRPPSRR